MSHRTNSASRGLEENVPLSDSKWSYEVKKVTSFRLTAPERAPLMHQRCYVSDLEVERLDASPA